MKNTKNRIQLINRLFKKESKLKKEEERRK